jgi:iron complex transport system substrate-binding protein
MKIYWLILISFILFVACSRKSSPGKEEKFSNHYARGFEIETNSHFTKLTVKSPWEKAGNISYHYYLVSEGTRIDSLKEAITIPVKRVICLSTTHLGFVSALGEIDKICGISGTKYVSDPELRGRIEKGEVPDVGYDQSLNYEMIVNLKPDVVFAYGVGSEVVGFVNRLKDLGIPVVLNAEYLEQSPLGKTEWIKFLAPFFGKDKMGDSIFNAVEANYLKSVQRVEKCSHHPVVMTGMPYKDQWWVPGGKAYLARMIKDAGADYLWKENSSDESFVVSPEQMVVEAEKADFWLNTGFVATLDGISGFDPRYTSFKPFKEKKVYNNDLRMIRDGGNDFWESGVVRPDLILEDLISIFHPEITGPHQLYYYRKLE